ncbi:non-hydrolyzing UDP-N-acetylglucosamine 2-epimerase [Massilibacteroides vaginae]|uniref:non-hydrolyzing UDP-N-acetylglucosamine 2-epimerase n=1 Tax=Massilibacteroides vaginae TaxID=1673718 RepID=UPI000A1C9846|nr:UDP-N-acetylglucosamine 2-epimerase (non-hydrolyzing) [Massilibacteroides vaginae]
MKKIMLVFGTRPEAIKMAPLVKELQSRNDKFEVLVCVTGQHREMLDQVLSLFGIKADYDLNIMKPGQDLYDITSNVLLKLRDVIKESHPDIVLVHGDTTTSVSAALAAFYQQVPVGHIEAGLRTYNKYSPWPEEVNRQMTSRIASLHFCPTTTCYDHLLTEGVDKSSLHITGNTVIDALHLVLNMIEERPSLRKEIECLLTEKGLPGKLFQEWNGARRLVLVTGHRRENFGDGFLNICRALKELSERYPSVDFVYPMHLNPNVRKPINEIFGEDELRAHQNVFFLEPLEYLPFVHLMRLSTLVLTDSGGIQEEAPGLGKPVLVMRDTTERPEAVAAGTVLLVGTNRENIVANTSKLLDDVTFFQKMSKAENPYGSGNSSELIANILEAN